MYEKIREDGTFLRKFKVAYNEIDYNLKLSPQKAAEKCQDLAVSHSDEAGYTVEYLREKDYGWVLTGWHIVFKNRPVENQEFEMETWTKPYKRLQAERSFLAKDMEGNELFRTASRWFLMNTQKRKPIKVPADFFASYIPATRENAIPDEDYTHPSIDLYTLHSTRDFKVTRRDIDSNFHTNNISYIDWAIDDITDEVYQGFNIVDLKADYVKEAMKGDTIRSYYYMRNINGHTVEATSLFRLAGESEGIEEQLLCRITTTWEER